MRLLQHHDDPGRGQCGWGHQGRIARELEISKSNEYTKTPKNTSTHQKFYDADIDTFIKPKKDAHFILNPEIYALNRPTEINNNGIHPHAQMHP